MPLPKNNNRMSFSPIGRARFKICIYRRDKVANNQGGRTVSEICINRIWAQVVDAKAGERFELNSVKHNITHHIFIRNNTLVNDPDNEHVIEFKGNRLRILAVRPINNRSFKWRIDCQQVDGSDTFGDSGQIFNTLGEPLFNTDGDPIFNTG